MATRTSGSASIISHASSKRPSISALSALRASGRFMVSVTTGPSRSIRRWGSDDIGAEYSPLAPETRTCSTLDMVVREPSVGTERLDLADPDNWVREVPHAGFDWLREHDPVSYHSKA